jgi:hypothetical protein
MFQIPIYLRTTHTRYSSVGVNNHIHGNFPKRNVFSDSGGGLAGKSILHRKVFKKAFVMTRVVSR